MTPHRTGVRFPASPQTASCPLKYRGRGHFCAQKFTDRQIASNRKTCVDLVSSLADFLNPHTPITAQELIHELASALIDHLGRLNISVRQHSTGRNNQCSEPRIKNHALGYCRVVVESAHNPKGEPRSTFVCRRTPRGTNPLCGKCRNVGILFTAGAIESDAEQILGFNAS